MENYSLPDLSLAGPEFKTRRENGTDWSRNACTKKMRHEKQNNSELRPILNEMGREADLDAQLLDKSEGRVGDLACRSMLP